MLSRLAVKPLLVRQHLVPYVPAAAKGFLKQLRLGAVRVKTDLKGGVLDFISVSNTVFSWPCQSNHPFSPLLSRSTASVFLHPVNCSAK